MPIIKCLCEYIKNCLMFSFIDERGVAFEKKIDQKYCKVLQGMKRYKQ